MTEERKRIVLGINMDFTADEVTRIASEQAQAFGAELLVVSSVVGHQLDKDGQPAEPQARMRMNRLKAQLDDAGVER